MSSNYPPGAANDPSAPYNQQEAPEIEVTVTEKLTKQDCIYSEGNVEADYREQRRTAEQCLYDAARVLQKAVEEKLIPRYYVRVNIIDLIDQCSGWEQQEFEVE